MTDDERHRSAVPPGTGELDGIDLAAVENGRSEIHTTGTTISPALHLAMHEIVANQPWAYDPPEVWHTAQRLTEAGYERHEVLHMLGSSKSKPTIT